MGTKIKIEQKIKKKRQKPIQTKFKLESHDENTDT